MDSLKLSQVEMEKILTDKMFHPTSLLKESNIDMFPREAESCKRNDQASTNVTSVPGVSQDKETALQNMESSMTGLGHLSNTSCQTHVRKSYPAEEAELLLFRDVEEWNDVVSMLVMGSQVRALSSHDQWS